MTAEIYSLDPASDEPALALERLVADLTTAADIYNAGKLEDQRFAVVSQLSSIFEFLVNQGFSPFVLEPMMRPIDALKNQYVNRLDPMFTQRRRAGKPEMSEDQLIRLGTLAALANAWLDLKGSGKDTNVQLSGAARRFRGKWFGQISVAQLKRARLVVSQEAVDHPAVQASLKVASFVERMVRQHGRGLAMDVVIQHMNDQQPSPALGNWETIKGEQT